MEGLVVFVALIATGYGFYMAGLLGALTGFIAVLACGTGVIAVAGSPAAGLASPLTTKGKVQKLTGVVMAVASAVAAYHGGWRYGWLWAAVTWVLAILLGAVVSYVVIKRAETKP